MTSVPEAWRTTQLPVRCRSFLVGEKCSTVCTWRSPTTMSARRATIGSASRGMSEGLYWPSASVLTITSAPSLSAASSPAWKAAASPWLLVSRTRWSTPWRLATSTVRSVEPSSMTSHSTCSKPGTSRGSSASTPGSDSSSFRHGIWMTSFIPRDRRVCSDMTRAMRIALLALCLGALACPASASALGLSVSGNHLVDESGRAIRLLGVSRSGSEYACAEGFGFFDGPTGARSIRAMKRWGINAVRLPLNPDCWLGTDGVKPALGGQAYRDAIDGFVARLNAAGLYVVIDEHVAAPSGQKALGIIPMPDADSSPAFWSSVASHFAANHSLVFDLYNEPHEIGWDCWLAGCPVPAGGRFSDLHRAYLGARGRRAVDPRGATRRPQPAMLGGGDYAP